VVVRLVLSGLQRRAESRACRIMRRRDGHQCLTPHEKNQKGSAKNALLSSSPLGCHFGSNAGRRAPSERPIQ
jgi:hypothetical protein